MVNIEENFHRWSDEYFSGEFEFHKLNDQNLDEYIERVISEKPQIVRFLKLKIEEQIEESEKDDYLEIINEYYDDDDVLREMIEVEIHEFKEKSKDINS